MRLPSFYCFALAAIAASTVYAREYPSTYLASRDFDIVSVYDTLIARGFDEVEAIEHIYKRGYEDTHLDLQIQRRVDELTVIGGTKPIRTTAGKAIKGFKIREGLPVVRGGSSKS